MSLLIGLFFSGVIIFPIFLFSKQLSVRHSKQEKARQTAIERNHVVTARLDKIHAASMTDNSTPMKKSNSAIYKYEYNGKTYKYRYSGNNPPSELTLYFLKNPRKAAVAGLMDTSEFPWFWVYIILALFINWIA